MNDWMNKRPNSRTIMDEGNFMWLKYMTRQMNWWTRERMNGWMINFLWCVPVKDEGNVPANKQITKWTNDEQEKKITKEWTSDLDIKNYKTNFLKGMSLRMIGLLDGWTDDLDSREPINEPDNEWMNEWMFCHIIKTFKGSFLVCVPVIDEWNALRFNRRWMNWLIKG